MQLFFLFLLSFPPFLSAARLARHATDRPQKAFPMARETVLSSPAAHSFLEEPVLPDSSDRESSSYKLYDVDYKIMTVPEWRARGTDRAAYSHLWAAPECFLPSTYLDNMKAPTCCRSVAPLLWLLVVLAAPIALAVHATEGVEHIRAVLAPFKKVWVATLTIPPGLAALELLLALALPRPFMRWGALVFSAIALAAIAPTLLWGNPIALAPIGFLLIFTVLFLIWMVPGVPFASQMLLFSRTVVLALPVLLTFCVFLVLVGGLVGLHGYIASHAVFSDWHPALFVPVVYTFWALALAVGEVLYQFVAQVVAAKIFCGPRGSEPRRWSYLVMLARALFSNLGVAAFNATVLPFLKPFYSAAQIDPSEVRERLKFCGCGGSVIAAIYSPFHTIAVPFCECVDHLLSWPCARAAVYSAMFGIPRKDAGRRVAEIDAKFYARVMNVNCYIDYLLGFIGLLLAVACAAAGWSFGKNVGEEQDRDKFEWLAAMFGFFAAFAFFNLVRALFAGIVDATFICYFENPEAMVTLSSETEERIRFEYEIGVRRKREVSDFKHRRGRYMDFGE
jgi:hypothetical protein